LTKEQKSYIGEKAVSSINGKTGYTHLEDWNCTSISHSVLKSILNGSKILM
jgi:hypothetical protein